MCADIHIHTFWGVYIHLLSSTLKSLRSDLIWGASLLAALPTKCQRFTDVYPVLHLIKCFLFTFWRFLRQLLVVKTPRWGWWRMGGCGGGTGSVGLWNEQLPPRSRTMPLLFATVASSSMSRGDLAEGKLWHNTDHFQDHKMLSRII